LLFVLSLLLLLLLLLLLRRVDLHLRLLSPWLPLRHLRPHCACSWHSNCNGCLGHCLSLPLLLWTYSSLLHDLLLLLLLLVVSFLLCLAACSARRVPHTTCLCSCCWPSSSRRY
jgi:hypothetical protein